MQDNKAMGFRYYAREENEQMHPGDVEFKIMAMLNTVFRLTLIFLLNFVAIQSFTQSFKVSGLIADDESGIPIPDVTVYINGTTQGTITNHSGEFKLDGVTLPCELILSHISYDLRRIPLQDTALLGNMSISLHKQIRKLEEATIIHEPLQLVYLNRFKAWFIFICVTKRNWRATIVPYWATFFSTQSIRVPGV